MVRLNHIFAIIATLISLLLTSCDATIHFYPEVEEVEPAFLKYDVEFELQYFDIDMPIHTIVENAGSRAESEPQHIGRHVIRIFDAELNVVDELIVTDSYENATTTHNHHFQLQPGQYTAVCWTDYSLDETDHHYDSSNLPEL